MGLARRTLEAARNRFLLAMKATQENWAIISSTLASLYQSGISIDWPQYYKPFTSSLSLLTLPTYALATLKRILPYRWLDAVLGVIARKEAAKLP